MHVLLFVLISINVAFWDGAPKVTLDRNLSRWRDLRKVNKGVTADTWLCVGFEWTWKKLQNCIFYLHLKEFWWICNTMLTELITLMYQTSKWFPFFMGKVLCTCDFNFDVPTGISANFFRSFSQQGCRRTESSNFQLGRAMRACNVDCLVLLLYQNSSYR